MRRAALPWLLAAFAHAQTVPLTINPARLLHPIDPKLYGHSLSTGLHDATAGAHPTLLRWSPSAAWKSDPKPVAAFFALVQNLRAVPVLVIPAKAESAEFVAYSNSPRDTTWGKLRVRDGHAEPYRVKYWELDLETSELTPDQTVEFLTAFVPALKKIDPAITILAPAPPPAAAHLIDILSLPRPEDATASAWQDLAAHKPRLKLFPSAWTVPTADWRGALSAARLFNAMEREPAIAMAASANNPIVRAVAGFYQDHFLPQLLAITGASSDLDVVATTNFEADRIVVKLVNPLPRETAVSINLRGDFPLLNATLQLASTDSLDARTFRPTDAKPDRSGMGVRLTLPRWSIAIVTLSR